MVTVSTKSRRAAGQPRPPTHWGISGKTPNSRFMQPWDSHLSCGANLSSFQNLQFFGFSSSTHFS